MTKEANFEELLRRLGMDTVKARFGCQCLQCRMSEMALREKEKR